MPTLLEQPISPNELEIPRDRIDKMEAEIKESIYFAIKYFKLGNLNKFHKYKDKLNQILIQMEELNNEISNKTSILDNSTQKINVLLNNLKLKNVNMNTEFNLLVEGRKSSSQMIDDYKKKYYLQYTTNWSIAIGIIIVLYLGYYFFKHRVKISAPPIPNAPIPNK